MVVAHDRADLGREAQLLQQRGAPAGVAADDGELLVGERRRLLQDRVGHPQLADVVEDPAEGEAAQAGGGEVELLAHLHGQQGDAAGVTLGRGVLLLQAAQQRVHPAAEEGLLLRHQVHGAQVAAERAGRDRGPRVQRHRAAHQEDPEQLRAVAHPEARLAPAVAVLGHQGGHQDPEAEQDAQVARPAGEQDGRGRADRHHHQARDADGDGEQRLVAALGGDGGHRVGVRHPQRAHQQDGDGGGREQRHQRADGPGAPRRGVRPHQQQHRAGREREPAGERDQAVVAHQQARGRGAVHGQEGGHRQERAAGDHRAPLPLAGAQDEEGERRGRRGGRGDDDDHEVLVAVEVHRPMAQPQQKRQGDRAGRGRHGERWGEPADHLADDIGAPRMELSPLRFSRPAAPVPAAARPGRRGPAATSRRRATRRASSPPARTPRPG